MILIMIRLLTTSEVITPLKLVMPDEYLYI